MKQIFLLFIISLLIAACGRDGSIPQNYTKVYFTSPKNNNKSLNVNLDSGLMIYAYNLDMQKTKAGHWNSITDFTTSGTGVLLPNGHYKFFALGYQDNSIDGTMYCDTANNGGDVTLNGGVVSLTLNLNSSSSTPKCRRLHFYPQNFEMPGNANEMRKVALKLCSNDPVSSCPTPTPNYPDVEFTILKKSDLDGDLSSSEGIKRCIAGATNGSNYDNFSNGPLRLPVSPHFPIRIRIFPFGSSCAGSPLKEYTFQNGLGSLPTFVNSPPAAPVGQALVVDATATPTYTPHFQLFLND